jgi:hypothetical protein
MKDKSTGIHEGSIENKIKWKVMFPKKEKIALRQDMRS